MRNTDVEDKTDKAVEERKTRTETWKSGA